MDPDRTRGSLFFRTALPELSGVPHDVLIRDIAAHWEFSAGVVR